MHSDNKKCKMRQRYDMLRAVGFTAKECNKYKYRSDENVKEVIEIKKRFNKLKPWVYGQGLGDNDVWDMAKRMSDESVNNYIIKQMKRRD